MDNEPQFPAAPSCDWERFCRELPHMLTQMEEMAAALQAIGRRLRTMDERDDLMAANISGLGQNLLVTHAQLEVVRGQTRNIVRIVEGMHALGTTPSHFAELARDVGGSARLTKMILKWVLAAAAAFSVLWGAVHLMDGKSDELQEPATQAP